MIMEWDKYGIDPKNIRGGKTFCPKCHDARKHKSDRSLSVNIETGQFRCHNFPCEYKGSVKKSSPIPKKEYIKPQPRLQRVSDDVVKWFSLVRGISNDTLLRLNITEAWEWMPQTLKEEQAICFNYMRDGELVNIKFRDSAKNFKMNSGSELIFYNIDALEGEKEAIIVEGELDCATNVECKIYNSVSVPNGASASGNVRLEYLDNCWERFENLEKIILATDDDAPGIALREELARRLGKHRCWKVSYPEGCKDINEVKVKHGEDAVRDVYANAFQYPIEGIITLEDEFDDVLRFFEQGFPKGLPVCIPGFDDLFTFDPENGQLTMITGMPTSGKSEFVDFIMAQMTRIYEWPWGVFSFETQPPSMHIMLLAEKIGGKTTQFRQNKDHRLTEDEFHKALSIIDNHYFFVKMEEADLTMDGIIEKCVQLVIQKGIKGVVIDPWNYIESKQAPGQTETQYINECLTKVKMFAYKYGVHVLLIAHPVKLKKENGKYEVPTLYHINGSSHFYNKADNGFSLWRDFESGVVEVHVQKIKRSWHGKLGHASFHFDTMTRQYSRAF